MATGAKPALDPTVNNNAEASPASDAKPAIAATLKNRIIQALTRIFEYNEELGSTRL